MKNKYLFKALQIALFSIVFIAESNAQEYIDNDTWSTMIKLGSYSGDNAIYKMPDLSSKGENYITLASTSGNAVLHPLTYTNQSLPKSYYINFSKNPAILELGKDFELEIIYSKDRTGLYTFIYCDWDRDGIFETTLKPKGNAMKIKQKIDIPLWAKTGKTRIRVRHSTDNMAIGSTDAITGGFCYDFIIYVAEKQK